jgi:nitroreductase
MPRDFAYDIMPEVKQRWSSRALSPEKINLEDLSAALEAARYAPSCYNAQPWRFVVAYTNEDLAIMRGFLAPKNQLWANSAPVLILVLAFNKFAYNDQPNRWAQFDTGTAWGYFSLELQHRGLVGHGMGGFDPENARQKLNIPKEYDLIAMIAVGKPGNKETLPREFQALEEPGLRIPLDQIVLSVKTFK